MKNSVTQLSSNYDLICDQNFIGLERFKSKNCEWVGTSHEQVMNESELVMDFASSLL